jgi:magnesium transporter
LFARRRSARPEAGIEPETLTPQVCRPDAFAKPNPADARRVTSSVVPPAEPGESSAVRVVDLDFERKSERPCALSDAAEALRAGHFLWIDLDASAEEEARRVLAELGVVEQSTIDDALANDASTEVARYEKYLHVVLAPCRQRGANFELERVDVLLSDGFFVTLHRGPRALLAAVRREYRLDFVRFARTPSFLLYEIWDQLIESYLAIQIVMERRVEELQGELRSGTVDDAVFTRLSELGADLLHFRKVLLPARAVLTDLATRRSPFVSDTTQSFLANLLGKLEHALQDLLVDRDILSDSLNLYLSVVSHRTNEVMKRLTVVSVVFLPLTFMCGVYGMNFDVLPELRWKFGYALFWLAVALVVAGLLYLMRRARIV